MPLLGHQCIQIPIEVMELMNDNIQYTANSAITYLNLNLG